MLTKNNFRRFYYVSVILLIEYLYRNSPTLLVGLNYYVNSFFLGLELSFSLLRVIIVYMLIVLILSRLTRTIIAMVKEVIAKPKRFLTVQIERFVNEVENKDRGRVLPVFSCILSLLPLLVVCCFFWKEVSQEASSGYTNFIIVIKTINSLVHFYMAEIYTSGCNFVSALNAVYNSIKSYFIGITVGLKIFWNVLVNKFFACLSFAGRMLMFQCWMLETICVSCSWIFKAVCRACLNICLETYEFASFYLPRIAAALYALFCGYATEIHRCAMESFHNSIFNHLYVASCAIYVALWEADMALSKESLVTENLVFKKRWGRHSFTISFCYPAVVQMLLRVGVCLVIFLFCLVIFLFIKYLTLCTMRIYAHCMQVRLTAKQKKEFKYETKSLKRLDFLEKSIDDESLKEFDFFKNEPASDKEKASLNNGEDSFLHPHKPNSKK